jgi:hypothetical protein
MDIEMFGQLLPEQANAPDSATTYGFAGPVTGTLPPLLSHQLIPNLGHAIKGPFSWNDTNAANSRRSHRPAHQNDLAGVRLDNVPLPKRFCIIHNFYSDPLFANSLIFSNLPRLIPYRETASGRTL